MNESGDPSVDQVPEEDFWYKEIGSDLGGNSEVTDNPNTAGKPKSINPFPCVL